MRCARSVEPASLPCCEIATRVNACPSCQERDLRRVGLVPLLLAVVGCA